MPGIQLRTRTLEGFHAEQPAVAVPSRKLGLTSFSDAGWAARDQIIYKTMCDSNTCYPRFPAALEARYPGLRDQYAPLHERCYDAVEPLVRAHRRNQLIVLNKESGAAEFVCRTVFSKEVFREQVRLHGGAPTSRPQTGAPVAPPPPAAPSAQEPAWNGDVVPSKVY